MALSILSTDELYKQAESLFVETFSCKPTNASTAPGRVNLIGEHTDYNNGFVLPMALPLQTIVVGSLYKTAQNDDCSIITNAYGVDMPNLINFKLPSESIKLEPGKPNWANYVKGVIAHFPSEIPSFRAAIVSSVPLGGGLSSSASIEVAFYVFLVSLCEMKNFDKEQAALLCQKAEHTFANMPCGIMDQTISVFGEKGHALLLDCQTLVKKQVHLGNPNVVILIINSNVRHELTGGEYAERRKQCFDAAKKLDIFSLRDATLPQLNTNKSLLLELEYKRARHVISENNRCLEAVVCLADGDITTFGKLMIQSHQSLKNDFEVSCIELDQLVDLVIPIKGVYGSRMTGGGFGGCTVTLCDKNIVKDVINTVQKNYDTEIRKATFYIVTPSEGANVLTI